jgi:hypothetical protein
MKIIQTSVALFILTSCGLCLHAGEPAAPTEKRFQAPHDMEVTVKMIGPYSEPCDLQIICVFRHKESGDKYLSAMKDLDVKLGGLLSSLRNRGEFVGEPGETLLVTPPKGSIVPPRLLIIGLGDESKLSLDTLRIVGRIALRQAVLVRAERVAFAPVIRDQGNSTIDVGEGDRAVIENVISAYDTELRLQRQKLSPQFSIKDWTIEAGPTFFAGAATQIESGIASAGKAIAARENDSYSAIK